MFPSAAHGSSSSFRAVSCTNNCLSWYKQLAVVISVKLMEPERVGQGEMSDELHLDLEPSTLALGYLTPHNQGSWHDVLHLQFRSLCSAQTIKAGPRLEVKAIRLQSLHVFRHIAQEAMLPDTQHMVSACLPDAPVLIASCKHLLQAASCLYSISSCCRS